MRARPASHCASCHGAAMTGVAPAVPGLLGLPRDYVLAQFGVERASQVEDSRFGELIAIIEEGL